MKVSTLIDRLIQSHFHFSNFLLEDELQAMQLVVDIVTAIALEDREILVNVDNKSSNFAIYKKIFALAKRRSVQLGGTCKLSMLQKAAFYFSEHKNFTEIEIESILGISGVDLILANAVVSSSIIAKLNGHQKEPISYAN